MKDPVGSFETIKENFIRYVKTAFGTKFEGIEKERYNLLNYDKVLYRKPWIEPLPDYVSSGKKINDLSLDDLGNALNEEESQTFKGLVNTGLVGNFPLHLHQAEMLKQALSGYNCIITSGTGSGKTESFLLPLFAQLSKEFAHWQTPNPKSPDLNTWWKEIGGLTPTQIVNRSNYTLNDTVRQRNHETRKAGVRALILYPMNALVEDQMSRLRKALDSDDTRQWLNSNANGNAIYFGRYNGSSPVAGELRKVKKDGSPAINTTKVKQLKERLQQIETDANRVAQYIQQTGKRGNEAKELKSFFQRLDGSEMRNRFDMQVAPPDILITNYSMLSIMLMRDIDKGIFEETRQWLTCEDLPENQREREKEKTNRIFHLIIDELHLYRGTQGTEVAYLLKLVLNRLGLHPQHPQLRILASSASLEAGNKASKNFVCDFFGVNHEYFNQKFKIIEGKNNPISAFPENGKKLPVVPFKEISEKFSNVKGDISDISFIEVCDSSATILATEFSLSPNGNGILKLLSVITSPEFQLKERLFSPCPDYKAVCSIQANGDDGNGKYFAETIFETTNNGEDLQNALRGLLIARALLDEPEFKTIVDSIPGERKLPRFRFHYFFRNIEGLWASVKPSDIDNIEYADDERTAGKLYSTTRINSERGNRVLELLYCDNCGTTLFGGSRLVTQNESGNHSFELLPISPNIEGIPEKTPAKLVEKRSYQEYAVFWACGNQVFTPHDAEQGISANFWRQTTVNGFNQVDYEANWIPASLNCISGDIDFSHEKATENPQHWVKGYYFTVKQNNRDIALPDANGMINIRETHKALPCVCPCCGVNHQKRRQDWDKSKTSSIRGFRTGFAKTTQIFAKELMYQLSNNEEERKLVVFSDSREDAAQIANGIERNHFTDLMREILVNELHSNLMLRFQIVKAFDNNDITKQTKLKQKSSEIFNEIEYFVDNSNYSGNNTNKLREKKETIVKLNEIRSLMINVRCMIDITNSVNLAPLIKRFVDLGINPGGNDISIQTRLLNNNFVPWYDLIDSTNFQWVAGADSTYINDLKEGSFSGLASIFFGTLFYSFESSALGYLTINQDLQIISDHANTLFISKNDFLQIINSTIRILGDKYKYNKVDDANPFNFTQYNTLPGQVKKYIRVVAQRFSKQENELGEAIFNTLSTSGLLRGDTGIQIENLFIKVAQPSDPVWTSTRGNRPHLHFSGGICTYSVTPLQAKPDSICNDIWEKNYLSYNAIKEQRQPIRLHCEELTGQTDNQFERQRHFRNIILPDEGNKQVKTIDLLSVTTTLEVGVDIGALQAVMLGNMPPQRFNYQQRVGRAGRRGQAYSVILTFCRGRSHDEFYFANPQRITGDAPPTPFLTMGQERIFKRLLAKEILRKAYIDEAIDISSDEKSSVHGEFGNTGDNQTNWNRYKVQIISWIIHNNQKIEETVDALITPQLQNRRADFINWIKDTTTTSGLIGKSQTIIDNEEIATTDISEKLAEGGILPMFGMPTTVKNLYHGIRKRLDKEPEPLSIDRLQSMAIYEFAPGAQKTKDKAIHQVIGFTSEWHNVANVAKPPFSMNRWFVRCRACGFFETYSEEKKTGLENQHFFDSCPYCGEVNPDKYQQPVKLKSPRAYRTNLSAGSDSKDDSELLLSRPPIFAEKVDDPNNPIQQQTVNNTDISISDKDVTWRVNTNSDRFFSGKLYKTDNRFPFNTNGFWFNDQWLLNDFAGNTNSGNGYSMYVQQNNRSIEEQIALASNKKTEIFRIAPANVPLALDLNMFFRETDLPHIKAQSNGVRSGYYSAAFLLQRILADKLDVDPTEIEIADISIKNLDDGTDRKIAEIILTDELPNGSGFVRHLYNYFQNIISETMNPGDSNSYLGKIHSHTHQEKCQDACYDCLKVYRNMNYHSLLDWRLGLSMLRIMYDENYACGTDGNFSSYIELSDWLDFAKGLRDKFAESFGFTIREEIQDLPVIKFGRNQKNIIMIVHPFWDLKNIREANWLAEIKMEIDNYTTTRNGKVSIIDTFNLHRRPGWCYEKLVVR